jgi:hypothetical protein
MLETVIAWTVYVLATAFVLIRFFIIPILASFFGLGEEEPEDDDSPRVGFIQFEEPEDWDELDEPEEPQIH